MDILLGLKWRDINVFLINKVDVVIFDFGVSIFFGGCFLVWIKIMFFIILGFLL